LLAIEESVANSINQNHVQIADCQLQYESSNEGGRENQRKERVEGMIDFVVPASLLYEFKLKCVKHVKI
jgi:hypothetical protein